MIKEGAIIVDVGINFEGGKICGDVDFEDVKERHEAERLANERCRKELAKLVTKKKKYDQLPLSLTMITQRRRTR